MKPFEYLEPQSIEEALLLLEQFKGEAKILAGGTDLLVQMKQQKTSPKYLIDVKNIPGLNSIEFSEERGLDIGSLTTIADLEESPTVRDRYPILYAAGKELGTQQVRNIATVGGNLCNASPAAETAPALIALGASAKIVSRSKEKVVKLEDFFTGPGETVLKTGELLVQIHIPNVAPNSKGVYFKHAFRRKLETAIVGVAVLASFNGKGKSLKDLRIVLGAVAPTPKRAIRAEELAKGNRVDGNLLEKVAVVASEESDPITDVRATAEYRREMVKVFVKRGLNEIVDH